MVRQLPTEIDEMFFVDIVLIFLLINYNMPLAMIYFAMAILGSLMYLVPVQWSLFKWIPMYGSGNRWVKIGTGAVFAFVFIYFFNQFSSTPMSTVFATTSFGDSEILTKIVYSLLIPLVETRFFFRTILQWWAWKTGDSVNVSPFSKIGLKFMVMFGAVFTVFHATAKGVDNNVDLMLTMVFGMLSVGMILHYKEMIQAVVMHVVVNAKAMALIASLATITSFASANTEILVVALVAGMFYFTIPKRRGRLSLPT